MRINIKPLSVNRAWKGRKYKTDEYKTYIKKMNLLLPENKKITNLKGSLNVFIEFGFSSIASDLDNPVKPLIDILQEKYNFNDKQIYELKIKKTIVNKGEEFILFKIKKSSQ